MDRFSTQIDKTSAETGRFLDLNWSTYSTTRVKFADYTRVVWYFHVLKSLEKHIKYACFVLFLPRFCVVVLLLENVICLSVVCYDNASKMR